MKRYRVKKVGEKTLRHTASDPVLIGNLSGRLYWECICTCGWSTGSYERKNFARLLIQQHLMDQAVDGD